MDKRQGSPNMLVSEALQPSTFLISKRRRIVAHRLNKEQLETSWHDTRMSERQAARLSERAGAPVLGDISCVGAGSAAASSHARTIWSKINR
jgi:hypothetical protein